MLQVHVWLPEDKMVGHAALSFRGDYVSFWPDGSANKKDAKIKRSHPGHFMESLEDDIFHEGDRKPITVYIQAYDHESLKRHILNLLRDQPRYQIVKYNCSHVVAECLKVACGADPSFTPRASDYGKVAKIAGKGIWTPNEVLRYARELSHRAAPAA